MLVKNPQRILREKKMKLFYKLNVLYDLKFLNSLKYSKLMIYGDPKTGYVPGFEPPSKI